MSYLSDSDFYRLYDESWRIWLLFIPLYILAASLFIGGIRQKIRKPLMLLHRAVEEQYQGRYVSVGDCGGPQEIQRIAKRIPFTPVGVTKEDYGKGSEMSEGIAMSLSDLQALLERVQGKKEKKTEYDSLMVKVTDISRVARVEQEIKKMGCNTDSMESIRKPMEEEASQKQMMLGGLGAISLFVAALGSVSPEHLLLAAAGGGDFSRISIIPAWLYGFAVLFSVFIGLASGYYPAERAVRVSALEAIRSE